MSTNIPQVLMVDPTFFNNHDLGKMMMELEFAKRSGSSFRVQCFIDYSNELLMKQYQNLVFLSDTINHLIMLETRPDLVCKYYWGGMLQYINVLKDLLFNAQKMLNDIQARYTVLVDASIILSDTKQREDEMCKRQQENQRRAYAAPLLMDFTQRPQIQISIV